MGNGSFVPRLGNIKVAIATSIFPNILLPVYAGTHDVLVLVPISGSQPAGAAHVTVTILVVDEPLNQVEHHFLVIAEVKPFGLLHLS